MNHYIYIAFSSSTFQLLYHPLPDPTGSATLFTDLNYAMVPDCYSAGFPSGAAVFKAVLRRDCCGTHFDRHSMRSQVAILGASQSAETDSKWSLSWSVAFSIIVLHLLLYPWPMGMARASPWPTRHRPPLRAFAKAHDGLLSEDRDQGLETVSQCISSLFRKAVVSGLMPDDPLG